MKAYVAKNVMGVFAFDEKMDLIDKILFPADPAEIANRLSSRCPEEEKMERKLSGYETDRSIGNPGEEHLNKQARNLALKFKWVKNNTEYNKILSKVNVLLTKQKMRETQPDRILMHAIGVLDEIDRTINVLVERLREWYGLYFPEAERQLSNHDKFAEAVLAGRRDNLEDKTLSKLAKDTAGMEFSDDDIKQMQMLAKDIKSLFHTRKGMESYINSTAKSVMPNTTAIAGPLLASRMLALAGGLEKMSRMPSSSIQLLGAEKALFRHLKGGGKAPKYGILFSHPYVQKAPKDKKGKVARLVAAKISLSARTDFYSKDDHSEEMASKLEKQVSGFLR
ncbi:MAG: hypothetical protein DRO99_03630 [Candidatus Aenigmatarchaeota archaeon]|nr:MAG: hypothetical protein DRO99_03630 [Candidatus Aenigmarchaeota archaeon]